MNGLPLDIRQSLSVDIFKRKLKSYAFDVTFVLIFYTASL